MATVSAVIAQPVIPDINVNLAQMDFMDVPKSRENFADLVSALAILTHLFQAHATVYQENVFTV